MWWHFYMIQVKRKGSVNLFLYGKEQQNIMKIIGNKGPNLWSDLATIFESLNNSYTTKVCGKKIENKLVPFWPKTLCPLVCREWLQSESNSRINNGNGAAHSWVARTYSSLRGRRSKWNKKDILTITHPKSPFPSLSNAATKAIHYSSEQDQSTNFTLKTYDEYWP